MPWTGTGPFCAPDGSRSDQRKA